MHWSVLVDPPSPAALHLGEDRRRLDGGEVGARVYRFDRPCVTIGVSQRQEVVAQPPSPEQPFEVVRRSTGGGALVHHPEELLYAIVVRLDHPGLSRDILSSYEQLDSPVLLLLEELGLAPTQVRGHGGQRPCCYLRGTGVRVLIGGKVVSGASQRRTRTHLLQHGTLLVQTDHQLTARLLREPLADVRAGITSLREYQVQTPAAELAEALARALGRLGDSLVVPRHL